jgi:hypothetical protein
VASLLASRDRQRTFPWFRHQCSLRAGQTGALHRVRPGPLLAVNPASSRALLPAHQVNPRTRLPACRQGQPRPRRQDRPQARHQDRPRALRQGHRRRRRDQPCRRGHFPARSRSPHTDRPGPRRRHLPRSPTQLPSRSPYLSLRTPIPRTPILRTPHLSRRTRRRQAAHRAAIRRTAHPRGGHHRVNPNARPAPTYRKVLTSPIRRAPRSLRTGRTTSDDRHHHSRRSTTADAPDHARSRWSGPVAHTVGRSGFLASGTPDFSQAEMVYMTRLPQTASSDVRSMA